MQIHFIQHKQFNVADVISHTFQKFSDFKIFPESFHGPLIAYPDVEFASVIIMLSALSLQVVQLVELASPKRAV